MKIYRDLEKLPALTRKTAIAIGVFDGLHRGHRKVIEAAVDYGKKHGAVSMVFTFLMNNGTTHKLGNKIASESIFFEALEAMGVELVLALPLTQIRELSPEEFVRDVLSHKLDAGFLSCGQDFHFGKNAAGSWKEMELYGSRYGVETIAVPLVMEGGEPISSTRVRMLIEEGDIPEANDMLGHRYAIDFEVVGGNRIGRTLGTPTINQPFPDGFVLPKFGVYATLSKVGEMWYTSVTNVGTKPTIGDYDALAETYIQGFSGNLYGQHIRVEFLQFIRKETKFSNIDLLRERIMADSAEAKALGELYLE